MTRDATQRLANTCARDSTSMRATRELKAAYTGM